MSEINFLQRRRAGLTKVEKQDFVYRRYALIFFSVAFSLFVVSIGSHIFLTQRLKRLSVQHQSLTEQIANDEPVEISFLIFSQKLKSIREIYENRSNKQQAIDYFSNIFGEQVFLSGMNYGGEGNQLTLRLTSEDIFAFENTLNVLDSTEVKNAFSSVTKSGLRRDETGSYSLDLAVELKKAGEQTNANPQ
ncbi:MAG: hypothetical protein UY13_C0002G0519 [Candidatus Pacebacteria bacterium GW2011_GWB1_47_8]|nr:MAG: hypothetical protein UX28_C0002G0078 [Candidatus Pacebacteria bacterium GW2011_GWA1_46_10]KKU84606.1 MAG: hypothetical protein UY13_C0002G0519 [Candidatus Pacebacteria bacterium GW2011_GWB1_47_8]HCR81387.1 hypothetical protein [Candidatus Paceibacterota bacterium]